MTYKDVTIDKFQQIERARVLCQGDDIRLAYNILSILTGKEFEYYKSMLFTEFQKECNVLDFLEKSLDEFEWVKEFECKGEKFKVNQHATDWTTEQFASMCNLTKDKDSIVGNLHLIIAVMTGDEKGVNRRAELFKEHLSIEVAYPIGFFFAVLLAKLSPSIRTYLAKTTLKKKSRKGKTKRNLTGLHLSGDGIRQLKP